MKRLFFYLCPLLWFAPFPAFAQASNILPGPAQKNAAAVTVSPIGISSGSSLPNNGKMFGPDTTGTTTSGLQEAINSLPGSSQLQGGGRLDLAPGIFYTTSQLLLTNGTASTTNATWLLVGSGVNACGIVYTGTATNDVILVTSGPGGTNGGSSQLVMRDMFVASQLNAPTNLLHVTYWGKLEIDDCWFGYWNAMTNNKVFGFAGLIPPSIQLSNYAPALVGVYLDYGFDNIGVIRNCDFLSLATGLLVHSDHVRVEDNMFLFCGQGNTWPNTNQISLGAAMTCIASLGANNIWSFSHNHVYGCSAGYSVSGTPGNAIDDATSYESTTTAVMIAPDSRWTQINMSGTGGTNALISVNPFAIVSGLETNRIRTVNLNSDPVTFSGGLAASSTNILEGLYVTNGIIYQMNVFGAGDANANGSYTNTTLTGGGAQYLTNTTHNGYRIIIDTNGTVNTDGDIAEIWTGASAQEYGFTADAYWWNNPLAYPVTWSKGIGAGYLNTNPLPVLQALMTNQGYFRMAVNGQLAGNLNANSIIWPTNTGFSSTLALNGGYSYIVTNASFTYSGYTGVSTANVNSTFLTISNSGASPITFTLPTGTHCATAGTLTVTNLAVFHVYAYANVVTNSIFVPGP